MYVVTIKQDELWGWEDSWKLSGAEFEPEDTTNDELLTASSFSTETTVMMRINNVFMPGWSDSWLLCAAPLEEEEEFHKSWSWGYRQHTRWVGFECPMPDVKQLSPFMLIFWFSKIWLVL